MDYFELAKQYGATASRKAKELIGAVSDAASQGYQQAKQTPGNVSTVRDALRGAGIDTSGPSWYDLRAALNQGGANLVGLYRGYIKPNLPRALQ